MKLSNRSTIIMANVKSSAYSISDTWYRRR